mmetsp:Transcript_12222/g.21792  ORF Transcript_12222/g.21792 Transcript_12222/m.21792 type:complete len:484 (-) Transcript_12222:285-1736(-)
MTDAEDQMRQLEALKRSKAPIKLGVFLFPGYELLDCYGPLEMYGICTGEGFRRFDIVTIGNGTSAMSPDVVVDFLPGDESIPPLDVIMVPGGFVENALDDTKSLEWLKSVVAKATLVTSICNGAAILAKIGALDGLKATTNKIEYPEIKAKFPNVMWQQKARWVSDGKFITSSGVSAGCDMALAVIELLANSKAVSKVSKVVEYVSTKDPLNDPFSNNHAVDFKGTYRMDEPLPDGAQKFPLRVGVYLYDNFEMLDTFGPLEMLVVANRFVDNPLFSVKFLATTRQVKSSMGPTFTVDTTTLDDDCANNIDILFIPGGLGSIREMHEKTAIDFLARAASKAKYVLTVCSGSSLLSRTGFLDNKAATTNKVVYQLLKALSPKVNWVPNARFVRTGNIWTSSGVSAGIDMTLDFLASILGRSLATGIAERIEYVWVQDLEVDPFAHLARSKGFLQQAQVKLQAALLGPIFRTGFALGFKMNTSAL